MSTLQPGAIILATHEIREHRPTARTYGGVIDAEIGVQPVFYAWDAVPLQRQQIFHRMKMIRAVLGYAVNCLTHCLDTYVETLVLNPTGHASNVLISNRTGLRVCRDNVSHEHRSAREIVVAPASLQNRERILRWS